MANTVTINSADELRTYKATILSNLAKSVWDISAIIESENAQEAVSYTHLTLPTS